MSVRTSLPLVLLCMACMEPPATSEPGNEGGLEVVRSAPPYPILHLGLEPSLRIGSIEGSGESEFSRVVFAGGLQSWGVVVVDAGTNDVRWCDRHGGYLQRAGGRGEGPGEFLGMVDATLLEGDTLAVFDGRNQRLTWLDPRGSLLRTRRLTVTSAFGVSLGTAAGGGLLVVEAKATRNIGGSEYNYARDTLLLVAPSPTDESVDTVLRLPGSESVTWVEYADGQPVATRQMEMPLGELALIAGTSAGVVAVMPGDDQLSFLNADGVLFRKADLTELDPPEASSELRERYVDAVVERAAEDGQQAVAVRRFLEARLALLPSGRLVPSFDRILVDARRSEVWIRHYAPPWTESESNLWTIIDRNGGVAGQVSIPLPIRPTHITDRRLVGVETDALGVEYVVAYPIEGPGR